jgi:hypothetical protein
MFLSKSAGITAGIVTGILFFLGFLVLGLSLNLSLIYGLVGGFANGWIFANWTSPDATKGATQPTALELPTQGKDNKPLSPRELFRQWQKSRYERQPSLFFWKNPRLTRPLKRELERQRKEREKQKQKAAGG